MFSTSTRCNICTFDILIIHYSNIKTSIPNPCTLGTLVFSHVWFFPSDLVKSEISCLLMIHFSCLLFYSRKMFNVVDDDPAPRAEVFAFARSLIQRRYPDLITETIDAKSTGLDYQEIIVPAEKRVSNARMKQELGVNLLHPTYRSGLQSILDAWQIQSQLPSRS